MAQPEAISSSKEFVLPQTGMFNPRKEKNIPAHSLPLAHLSRACVAGLSGRAVCRDGWMEPDSVSGNGIAGGHLRESEV